MAVAGLGGSSSFSSDIYREALQNASPQKEAEDQEEQKELDEKKTQEKKQREQEKTRSEKAKEKQAPPQPADALSPHAKTRHVAGFSLGAPFPPEAGTIDASQAQQTAQLSRAQMVRGADAALVAQGRRLSPQVLVLLY